MTNLADIVAERSTTVGTGSYALDGPLPYSREFDGGLTDGQQYAYFAQFDDLITPGYELGVGTWNQPLGEFTRDSITQSSASGDPVSWPAGYKRISIVADAAMLDQSAMYSHMEDTSNPHQVQHDQLSGRSEPDQHPTSSIAGLAEEQAAQDQALADHTIDPGGHPAFTQSDNGFTPTPAAGDTMASHAGWTEIEAYTEGARPALTLGSVSGQSVDNSASKAVFTVNADGQAIGGAFITTNATKGGSTGILYSVAAFNAGDKGLDTGDTLNVSATCTASAA